VQRVAHELGIEHYRYSLLPEEKLERLQTLQQQGVLTAVVGDGVNDAPMLARAAVSIALGSGTDIARSHADMVLITQRLDRFYQGVIIARRTLTIIRQNLSWALIYNALALPLAAGGWIAPWMAATGMSASSLLVVLNALRLSRLTPLYMDRVTAVKTAAGTRMSNTRLQQGI
jgi:Cu2+-exporting ATPase